MKILDVLSADAINVDLKAKDKKEVLDELAAPLAHRTNAPLEELIRVLMERERLGSTGIGGGIGIPHGKLKGLPSMVVGFGLSRRGVGFESIDGRPVHLFFLLLTPENAAGTHLKLLAHISRLLKHDEFKKQLMQAATPEEVIEIIREKDHDF